MSRTKEEWLQFCDLMINWCNQILEETSIAIELENILGEIGKIDE